METKNTFDIQMASLDAFASVLGYQRSMFGNHYIFDYDVAFGEQTVSFKTMVALHNAQWYYDETDNVFYPHREKLVREKGKFLFYDFEDKPFTKVFNLSPYEYRKAQSRKIVNRVKIQCNKHGALHCQSHDVEFACPLYEKEFLGE